MFDCMEHREMQKTAVAVDNLLLQDVDVDVVIVESDSCHAKKDHHALSFL